MDYTLYILLITTAIVLGTTDSAVSCKGNNCHSTDTNSNYTDEGEVELYSPDPDLRELYLDGCSNLTVLELTPNLRTLEIFNCSWEYLNISEFSAVANLSSLQMRGGRLLELDREQFAQLPHLEILELASNDIRVVSQDSFMGVPQLWMLTLNNNRIEVLPENLFFPLPELRYLDLSYNRIKGLPEGIFTNNPKLEVFTLRRAWFLRLSPKVLESLKNLIYLDLSSNNFRELKIHSADSVCLENTGMHNLEVLGKVSQLQANYNYLDEVHFENRDSVKELDLHENGLETDDISDILPGMWRLQRLDISLNLVKELPFFTKNRLGEVFLLPSLRFVNMSRNLLIHVRPDSPLLSPSLTHLDLSFNRIRSLEPHTFSMASRLQSLYIQGNRLEHFQYDLFHNQQRVLQEVALYGNDFSNDTYEKITKYFTKSDVLVLEKNPKNAERIESHIDSISHSEKLIRRVHPKRERIGTAHRDSADLHFLGKWSTWNVLIFLCLLALLTHNVILIRQHLRFSGKRAWRRRQSSKIIARFIKTNDNDI